MWSDQQHFSEAAMGPSGRSSFRSHAWRAHWRDLPFMEDGVQSLRQLEFGSELSDTCSIANIVTHDGIHMDLWCIDVVRAARCAGGGGKKGSPTNQLIIAVRTSLGGFSAKVAGSDRCRKRLIGFTLQAGQAQSDRGSQRRICGHWRSRVTKAGRRCFVVRGKCDGDSTRILPPHCLCWCRCHDHSAT